MPQKRRRRSSDNYFNTAKRRKRSSGDEDIRRCGRHSKPTLPHGSEKSTMNTLKLPQATDFSEDHDEGASLISTLSFELLRSIFDLIADTSPDTIPSLAFVNKRFHHIARGFIDRDQTFKLVENSAGWTLSKLPPHLREQLQASQRSNDLIESLLEDPTKPNALNNIRNILLEVTKFSLCGYWEGSVWKEDALSVDHSSEEAFTNVIKLIERLPIVKNLTFRGDSQVPLILINILQQYHSGASLHVQGWKRAREDEDHNNPAEIALANSPNLRSISTSLNYTDTHHDLRPAAFKRIIALAPNLESVTISPYTGWTGCCPPIYTHEQWQETQRLATFFEVEDPSPNAIKTLITDREHYVRDFANATDLSKLERLETGSCMPNFFNKNNLGEARFQSLAHLSLTMVSDQFYGQETNDETNDETNAFLTSCKPLQTLSIKNWFNTLSLPEILLHHGPTLRHLSLLSNSASATEPRDLLSTPQLQSILTHCPSLHSISLDTNRSYSGTTEASLFSSLSHFSCLQTINLKIHPSPPASRDNGTSFYAPNPFWTKNSGWLERTWSLLPSSLKELCVDIGTLIVYSQWDLGQPVTSDTRQIVRARKSERDDRGDEILVYRGFGEVVKKGEWEARNVGSWRGWKFGEEWERVGGLRGFEVDPPGAHDEDPDL